MYRTFVAALLGLLPCVLLAQEVCNNGVDDDGNGLIDLNDPACPCASLLAAEGLPSFIRNHSFEELICCPYGYVTPVSPPWLSCATGWSQATEATSDHFNNCGYMPSFVPQPLPDGDGCVGFQSIKDMDYFEYVGTCLTFPAPSNPLLAGTTYTLSLWISGSVTDNQLVPGDQDLVDILFPDDLPLALFGYPNACVSFPIPTMSCMGQQPGWIELGRVAVQSVQDWTQVSITFTPTQDIHSVVIGAACDLPDTFTSHTVLDEDGNFRTYYAYFMVDKLLLTEAGDQMLSPVSATGTLCAGTAQASAFPPAEGTGYQWYHEGVAIPGATGLTLDISQTGLGGGAYSMATTVDGECLMGVGHVLPGSRPVPMPSIVPASGCAPLEVDFADASAGSTTVQWTLGDGTLSTDSAFSHIYNTPGTYDVLLSVVNALGCSRDTLLVDAVTVHAMPVGFIDASPEPTDIDHPDVLLDAGSSQGDIVAWWWDLGVADPPFASTPTVQASFPQVPGEYPVMLVVATAAGCIDTIGGYVRVTLPDVIEMPNVFSPNGDGHNDRFVPVVYYGSSARLEIFNRWGQSVFTTASLAQGWSGQGSPDGTYYYVVTPDDGRVEKLTGHVTLVR
ncbi:MAG TPA: gliding motility-associated C-terminal domain-containing protein [Flavobacteriales bacterium]